MLDIYGHTSTELEPPRVLELRDKSFYKIFMSILRVFIKLYSSSLNQIIRVRGCFTWFNNKRHQFALAGKYHMFTC